MQFASFTHCTQLLEVVSQFGVAGVPLQSGFAKHCTQVPVAALHSGLVPEQASEAPHLHLPVAHWLAVTALHCVLQLPQKLKSLFRSLQTGAIDTMQHVGEVAPPISVQVSSLAALQLLSLESQISAVGVVASVLQVRKRRSASNAGETAPVAGM